MYGNSLTESRTDNIRLHKNCQDRREKENMQGKSEYDGEWKQVKKGRNVYGVGERNYSNREDLQRNWA